MQVKPLINCRVMCSCWGRRQLMLGLGYGIEKRGYTEYTAVK